MDDFAFYFMLGALAGLMIIYFGPEIADFFRNRAKVKNVTPQPDDPGVRVVVNGKTHSLRGVNVSYYGVLALAGLGDKGFQDAPEVIVTWRTPTGHGTLAPGGSVKIRAGMEFMVK
jgi:hypothetical protein